MKTVLKTLSLAVLSLSLPALALADPAPRIRPGHYIGTGPDGESNLVITEEGPIALGVIFWSSPEQASHEAARVFQIEYTSTGTAMLRLMTPSSESATVETSDQEVLEAAITPTIRRGGVVVNGITLTNVRARSSVRFTESYEAYRQTPSRQAFDFVGRSRDGSGDLIVSTGANGNLQLQISGNRPQGSLTGTFLLRPLALGVYQIRSVEVSSTAASGTQNRERVLGLMTFGQTRQMELTRGFPLVHTARAIWYPSETSAGSIAAARTELFTE